MSDRMSRSAIVSLYGKPAGVLTERPDGYVFEYYSDYHGIALSLSLPTCRRCHYSKELHPFFKSIAPEGWLLEQYSRLQKIDEQGTFGMICQNGQDMIGAVTIEPLEK